MPRGGSKPGERRGGRKKGTPNHLTASAKQAFQFAFNELGGPQALAEWGKSNQTEFYKLFARLIPNEVTGPEGGALVVTWQQSPN